MKGVSTLLSHALELAIIIGAFTVILVYASNMRNSAEEQFLNYQLNYFSAKVADEISSMNNLYADSAYAPTDKTVLAKIKIPLDSNIPIWIKLSSGSVTARASTGAGKGVEASRQIATGFQNSGESRLPAFLILEKQGAAYSLRVGE